MSDQLDDVVTLLNAARAWRLIPAAWRQVDEKLGALLDALETGDRARVSVVMTELRRWAPRRIKPLDGGLEPPSVTPAGAGTQELVTIIVHWIESRPASAEGERRHAPPPRRR